MSATLLSAASPSAGERRHRPAPLAPRSAAYRGEFDDRERRERRIRLAPARSRIADDHSRNVRSTLRSRQTCRRNAGSDGGPVRPINWRRLVARDPLNASERDIYRYIVADFESAWDSVARSPGGRGRGNYLFARQAMTLLEFAGRLAFADSAARQALEGAPLARRSRCISACYPARVDGSTVRSLFQRRRWQSGQCLGRCSILSGMAEPTNTSRSLRPSTMPLLSRSGCQALARVAQVDRARSGDRWSPRIRR